MLCESVIDEPRPLGHRVLYRCETNVPFAYVRGNALFRYRDHALWAHVSDGELRSARSGEPLAYQRGNIFYDAITNEPLYYEGA